MAGPAMAGSGMAGAGKCARFPANLAAPRGSRTSPEFVLPGGMDYDYPLSPSNVGDTC